MNENSLLNNRYRLIKEEGTGGMAVVYKAQDLELDRMVAVKVLKPELTADPEFLMRFRAEARAAASLSHPNIVTVHDFGQDGRTHYMVLEYVEGDDLKQVIRQQGMLDIESSLLITIELCKGLGYAHRAGLVHCDIKPQNVLVTHSGQIRLADFGLARALSASLPSEAGIVWGTPSYLAPERSAGEPPTPASDVYSLGIVMFEMSTGELPFKGTAHETLALAHMQQAPPILSALNPLVPDSLNSIVGKVLSKEPSQRYRTADQLGRILIKLREQSQQVTSAIPVTPSRPPTAPPPDAYADQEELPDPVMPPLTVESLKQRDTMRHMPATQTAVPQAHESYQDDAAGIDLYSIVLALLTLGAILGLIPLWISVFNTFVR